MHIEEETGRALQPVWPLWKKKNLLLLPGIDPRFLGRPSYYLASISTALYRLPFLRYTTSINR
jgi:hypothetical protein